MCARVLAYNYELSVTKDTQAYIHTHIHPSLYRYMYVCMYTYMCTHTR